MLFKTFSYFMLLFFSIQVRAESRSEFKSKSPFYQPQFTFLSGKFNSHFVTEDEKKNKFEFSAQPDWLNGVYGLDIEVNYNSYLNIGGSFLIEVDSQRKPDKTITDIDFMGRPYLKTVPGDTQTIFHGLLGGFTRFFYPLPFLNQRVNLFSRLDLKIGPFFDENTVNSSTLVRNGFEFRGMVTLGAEIYLNQWLGFNVSYGRMGAYNFIQKKFPSDPKLKGTSYGEVYYVGIKTTFL